MTQANRRVHLHGIACEILGKDVSTYTSHTWCPSVTTNLADSGVSFITAVGIYDKGVRLETNKDTIMTHL